MATYSDKYLFEFETKRADATANSLGRINTQAIALTKSLRELAVAYSALLTMMGRTPKVDFGSIKKMNVVNANQTAGDINVDSFFNSGTIDQSRTSSRSGSSSAGTRSTYLRDTSQRIMDYTKFWLIGWGINQAVQLISGGIEQWAQAQMALNQIVAEFEVSLNTSSASAQEYTQQVLAVSRATGISMREIGPGMIIQKRVHNAPSDLTLRAAQVQRITGADNYSVERDLLSLAKQFPDKSTVDILDAFTGAMRKSSLTAAEFFDLLESSGPLAKQFNTSMESIFGMFAGLSTATGESGPAIELFMRQMERVYTDADTRAAVEKHTGPVSFMNPQTGYEIRKPFEEIMQQVSRLTKDAQQEIALTIPNMLGQQTRQLFLAMMQDWDGVASAISGAKNATGEFDRAVGIHSKTWIAQTQAMATAWESFLATIKGSQGVLSIIAGVTDALNHLTLKNFAQPAIDRYNEIYTEPRNFVTATDPETKKNQQKQWVEMRARFGSPEELFRKETGMEATYRKLPFLPPVQTPEYMEWAAINMPKYLRQFKGETGPDVYTDYQKKDFLYEYRRGYIDEAEYTRRTGEAPSRIAGFQGPIRPTPASAWGNPFTGAGMRAATGSQWQPGPGMMPMYLEDQKLTLPPGVTAQALQTEIARIQKELIDSYRKLQVPDAQGRTTTPYKNMSDIDIMNRAGFGTSSPLMALSETNAPLATFTGNIGLANMALDNLEAKLKATTPQITGKFSGQEWFQQGKGSEVTAEYNRLLRSELGAKRGSGSQYYAMTDDQLKQEMGIEEELVRVMSETGAVLTTTTADANLFAQAMANVAANSKDATETLNSRMTLKEWYGGGSTKVVAEYNKMVQGEIDSYRQANAQAVNMTDAEIKKVIGISEGLVQVLSETGTVMGSVTAESSILAAAIAQILGAMQAGLSYFDTPEWMGEEEYVRRLNTYSRNNLSIQEREGMQNEEPTTQRYVGPSGKAYSVFGNTESIAQAQAGIGRDDTAYNKNQAILERQRSEAKAAADKQQAYLRQINDGIKSMVSRLLQMTPVTTGDLAAAKLGKYQDKWDEPVRRVRDAVGRREAMNPDLGPWAGFAQSLGIDLSDIPQAQFTGAEFERKYYNGLMAPEFYDQYAKQGFIASAQQMMAEKQGRKNLEQQALGWLKEAGIEGNMAELIASELSGNMSPMETYWRGGKSDQELSADLGNLAKATVSSGITPGYKSAVQEAKPVDIFVDAFGLDKQENRDVVYKLGTTVGTVMTGGIADAIAASILGQVTAKVTQAIINGRPGGAQ